MFAYYYLYFLLLLFLFGCRLLQEGLDKWDDDVANDGTIYCQSLHSNKINAFI